MLNEQAFQSNHSQWHYYEHYPCTFIDTTFHETVGITRRING